MNIDISLADRIIRFYEEISALSIQLPDDYYLINPLLGDQREKVKKTIEAFYRTYYNDSNKRRLILGSSPARKGSAVTGVPFEDARHLEKISGNIFADYSVTRGASDFLLDVINIYGGRTCFYTKFYMNFVCPFGIVKINNHGHVTNCNYYDDRRLVESLTSLIVYSIKHQIALGIDNSVCYCIGSGKNYEFLSKLNDEYVFFKKIIPLEHPRYIMQYNSINKEFFVDKYMKALCDKDGDGVI